MSLGTDQNYLLTEQYKDSTSLGARVNLHERFSTNKYGWHPWVFDHLLTLPADSHILEVGCGPCYLWQANQARIPAGWQVTLSDFSPGMVETARQNLSTIAHPFDFRVIDAQSIPLADASLDAVIANHMLYHVPDLDKALAEFQRVLKPGGGLFATTVGRNHHRQMDELRRRFIQTLDLGEDFEDFEFFGADTFILQNGERLLLPWFAAVARHDFVDWLAVTEAEPLAAYMVSGMRTRIAPELYTRFLQFIGQELSASGGTLRIDKESGLFEAIRPVV